MWLMVTFLSLSCSKFNLLVFFLGYKPLYSINLNSNLNYSIDSCVALMEVRGFTRKSLEPVSDIKRIL